MDTSACRAGGLGPVAKQTELLGVGYSGRLLNGAGGQAGDSAEEEPSAALLRITLLQLQRALTQNAALSDALRAALAGEERTSTLLRQHKLSLEEAAARNSAAVERTRSLMAAELDAAKKHAEEACSLMAAEVEKTKKSATEAREAAEAETSVS